MFNIKIRRLLKNLIPILLIAIFFFQIKQISAINLFPDNFEEKDISNDFYNDNNFIKNFGGSMHQDSVQLSSGMYASVLRDNNCSSGKIMLIFVNEQGNKINNKIHTVHNTLKLSLTSTGAEGEVLLAFISKENQINKIYYVFFSYLNNFSRGMDKLEEPTEFADINFDHLLTKCSNSYCYLVSQTQSLNLYLMIIDISVQNTYSISYHEKFTDNLYRENLFSIQAFSDNYFVFFAKDDKDKLKIISVKGDKSKSNEQRKDAGIFMNLAGSKNSIQNKIIKVPDTDIDYHVLVTGDENANIFTIYTFQYKLLGSIEQKCLKNYQDQFLNVGNQFFYALEFGVINSELLWIKADYLEEPSKTVLFFANPLTCEVYRNGENNIIQYEFRSFGNSHLFHTYFESTLQIFAVSSLKNGSESQSLEAVKIDLNLQVCGKNCATCSGDDICKTCKQILVDSQQVNHCFCPQGYSQDADNPDNCIKCGQYCSTCSNTESCLSCIQSNVVRDITNQCQCPDYFIQNNNNITSCVYKGCIQYNFLNSKPVIEGHETQNKLCQPYEIDATDFKIYQEQCQNNLWLNLILIYCKSTQEKIKLLEQDSINKEFYSCNDQNSNYPSTILLFIDYKGSLCLKPNYNPTVYCEYFVKNNEVDNSKIKTYQIEDNQTPQVGDICFSFDPGMNSYINLKLGEIGNSITFGGFFYWKQFGNMNKVQLFYFGDSNDENLISVYYDVSLSLFVVSYEVEGGKTNTYKFTSSIKYDIYVHYMFIIDVDGVCQFYKNFNEVKSEKVDSYTNSPVVLDTREFTYVGKSPDNKSDRQNFGGRVENIIFYNGKLTSTQMDCIKADNVCDESQSFVDKNNCLTCNNRKQVCTSCNSNANFVLDNSGNCVCDFGYKQSGKSCFAEENIIPGISQEQIQSVGTTSKAAITSMVATNPTMAITLIDTLQMIKYITYLDYEFPNIIYVYFEIFSGMVDFDYLPTLTPSNSNFQDPPNGFQRFGEDGYLLGNINSYIWLTFGCGLTWWAMRKVNVKIDYRNRRHIKLKQLFRKILQKFEYDIFFMGVIQSFLFVNICCLITLKSLDIDNLLKGMAYIIAIIIIFVQFGTIFAIYKLSKVYRTNTLVYGDPDIDEQDINELHTQMKAVKKGKGLLNPDLDYEEEDEKELSFEYVRKNSTKKNGIEVIQEVEEEYKDDNEEKEEQNSRKNYKFEEAKLSSAGAVVQENKMQTLEKKSKNNKKNKNKDEENEKNQKEEEKEEVSEKRLTLFELTFNQKTEVFENQYMFYQFFKQTNFLFEDFKHESLWQLNYQTVYCLRKFIYSFCLVYLNENVTSAICIWVILNFFMIWYFIKHKPQEFKRSYWNELTQEFWFLIIYFNVIVMTVANPEDLNIRQNLSYIIMGFATLILVQDIIMSFYDTAYSIYEATCLRFRHAKNEQLKKRQKKMKEKYIFDELDQIERADQQKAQNQ